MTVTVIAYDLGMGRWEPNARGRLEQAAMELYNQRGYESTTVAEIAGRAGLTERTFFRYFADKREVLFAGAGALQELLVGKVSGAPASLPPIEAIATALAEVATVVFEERREFARQRQAIIAANAELRERELIKLASLASAVAASLAAEAGMAVFRIAFERWTSEAGERPLSQLIQESVDELKLVTAGR